MRSVRLGDYLAFDGSPWQVMAVDGPEVVLKNQVTSRIRRVSLTELLGDDSFLPDSPVRLPALDDVAVLSKLSDPVRERTLRLHSHVVEVITGVCPATASDSRDVAPRTGYDPAKTRLGDRLDNKVAELAAAGSPVSRRTLQRHIAAYRERGIAGLVDDRHQRRSSIAGRSDPRLVAMLEREIARQENVSTGTRERAITRVMVEAEAEGVPVPSRATIYRVLRRIEEDRHPFGNATTRRSQTNRPDRTWGRRSPSMPGELVEIDSTPLDLMVTYPDSGTGRVDLTVALDIATRTPLAAIVRPVATKSVDAAILLAKAMTPLAMQPGWAASLSYTRSMLPEGMIPGDEEVRGTIAAKPVIVPSSITIDRGRVFVGDTFRNACERLHISIVMAAPRTPTDKPHIERFFKTLNTQFTQYLSGYTGPNVVRRGKDPASEAVFTLDQVQNLLDWWIVAIWQNRPHSGLRIPEFPKRDLTPNEMYKAMAGVAPQIPAVLTRDDYISLLPLAWRKIQPYGINFDGLHYDSPELRPYRGVPSGLPSPAAGKWEIRYDPYRMRSIFLRDHKKGRWIEVEWALARQTVAPFSQDVLTAAKRGLGPKVEPTPVLLLGEINRIMTAATGRAETQAARRAATAPPTVPDLEEPSEVLAPVPPRPAAKKGVIQPARRIDLED